MNLKIKLNGICDPQSCAAALDGRADFIGFIFAHHPTLRITPALAGQIATNIPSHTAIVGCFQNPLDAELEDALSQAPIDYIQLNGNEDPSRIHELRQHFGLPIIKSIALSSVDDVAAARQYEQAADYLLFTGRPAANVHSMAGSTDLPFDWNWLAGIKSNMRSSFHRPWFLSGGLHAGNISAAILATNAQYIDMTGGLAGKNGKSSPALITEILGKRRDLSPILAPTILE